MPARSVALLVLALPAAIAGYAGASWVLGAIPLPDGLRTLVLLFVPLLAAGLCALPFLVPAFDHLAKRALADRPADDDPPDPPEARRGRP